MERLTNESEASYEVGKGFDLTVKPIPVVPIVKRTRSQKFEHLQDLVLDTYIDALEAGGIKPMELAPIVTLLKNNKVVQEKSEQSESEIIDALIEDPK